MQADRDKKRRLTALLDGFFPGDLCSHGQLVYVRRIATIVRNVRNATAAIFTVFGAGAGIAKAAEAPEWLLIVFGAIAAEGALIALGLLWLERKAERGEEISGRYKDAVALLGEVAGRVGAIYLLERISQEAPKTYYGPMVRLLNAYIRAQAPWPPIDSEPEALSSGAKRRPRQDVQAALEVLGRRNSECDPPGFQLRLSDVDLRGARLRGGHFARARFRRSHLEDARLEGAELQGASLEDAHFEGADFSPALDLDLHGANLDRADLRGTHFEYSKLEGASLKGATYNGSTRWPNGFDPEKHDLRRVD